MQTLQTLWRLQLGLQKVDQHTEGKWVIHGNEHHQDYQLHRLRSLCGIPYLKK